MSLGVQVLGDLAYQWFSGMATDKNGLFQAGLNSLRQRTNQPSNSQPTSTDIQKLWQMVDRVIASVGGGASAARTAARAARRRALRPPIRDRETS